VNPTLQQAFASLLLDINSRFGRVFEDKSREANADNWIDIEFLKLSGTKKKDPKINQRSTKLAVRDRSCMESLALASVGIQLPGKKQWLDYL
jgi:hypothetical protein